MENRIRGAIYGLLIGDAVGVPYEFKAPSQLPPIEQIDIIPPKNFSRTYPTVKIGSWSDDGSQALCLLSSLLECQKLNIYDLMNRFANWFQHGYMAVGNYRFDCGIQTANAISGFLDGIDIMQCASDNEYANGNGSLMRTLPLALWHTGSDEQLIADAFLQSHITHAHRRSKICCALYCLWARYILQGKNINDSYQQAVDTLYQTFAQQNKQHEIAELDYFILPTKFNNVQGKGYVVDCLKSAYIALQEPNYQAVIQKAISFGNDTDTTACVAGGIAGLYFGFDNIPTHWVENLQEQTTVEPLVNQLIQQLNFTHY